MGIFPDTPLLLVVWELLAAGPGDARLFLGALRLERRGKLAGAAENVESESARH